MLVIIMPGQNVFAFSPKNTTEKTGMDCLTLVAVDKRGGNKNDAKKRDMNKAHKRRLTTISVKSITL